MSALFIAIEGLDGSGGTTQARLLAEWFRGRGREVLLTNEPSSGLVGQFIRRALSTDTEEGRLDDAVLPYLFAADRRDHVDREIVPMLQHGGVVVTDRYYHSSLAYQSLALGLPAVATLNEAFPAPDLTIFLELEVEACLARVEARGEARERFEALDHLRHVHDAYDSVMVLCRTKGENVVRIDASGSREDIAAAIVAEVKKLL